MRRLVTGFITGSLVTLVAMLVIFGDGDESAAVPGDDDNGTTAAGSLDAVGEDVERRRRAALSSSSASATVSRAPGRRAARPESDASQVDASGSAECCSVTVSSTSGRSTEVDESVAVPVLVNPGLAPSRPYLTGKWEGVMTGIGAELDGSPSMVPPFDEARGQFGFRLDIRETNLVMYFRNGDQWISLGEGQDLRTNEQGRSAIAVTSVNAANGGIEAMVLNIMLWNEETIAVHMSRVTGAGPDGGPLSPPVNSMGFLDRATF